MPPAGEDAGADRWVTGAFLAGTAILCLLFYRGFVFHPDRMLFGTDMVIEGFPLRRFALEEIRAGRGLPLWNPYLLGGLPFVATLPGPLFYPTSLLYLLLPLHRAIGWTFVLHSFLAGAFAFFAARAFGLRRGSATVCGLSFMLTGYLASTLYGGHDGRMFAIVLIPLAFGMAERGLRSGRGAWFLGVAAAVALQALTPHVQIMYFSTLSLLSYAGVRLALPRRDEGNPPERPWRLSLGLVAALALAAGLAAVQLLPTYALLGDVSRAAQERGYEFAASWALPPQELSALFLPDLIGSLGRYWGENPFKLHTEYLGGVPVALAILGVVGGFGRGRATEERRTVGFLAAASLLGILFALGASTPVHRVAYAVVPLMRSFRAPAMMLGPVAFFVALLAGFGWEAVRRRKTGVLGPVTWLAAAPFLLLGLAAALAPDGLSSFAYHSWFPGGWARRPPPELAGALRVSGLFLLASWGAVLGAAWASGRKRGSGWWLAGLLALTLMDLWRVDARYLQTARVEEVFPAEPPGLERLAASVEPGERVWPLERTYEANELMYYGVRTVSGTQKFLFSWYRRLVGGLGYENLLRQPALWQLLDLRFVTARSELDTPLLRPVEETERGRIYEVVSPAPHVFFPARVTAVEDTAEALRRTLALVNAAEEAVVEAGEVPPVTAGTAELARSAPDELELRVRAAREGLLVLSEVWAPGWHAYVGGTEVPVLRADAAFRAIVVPAGEHRVRFLYRPTGFRWGVRLSGASLLVLLGGLGVTLRRPRRG